MNNLFVGAKEKNHSFIHSIIQEMFTSKASMRTQAHCFLWGLFGTTPEEC